MALKKTKGLRIESKTLTSQLAREGFDFAETNLAFSDVALFFLHVVSSHPEGLSLGKARMKFYEDLTVNEGARYPPPMECPSTFRRAAMNKAIGIYQSWKSNFERWQAREEKRASEQRGEGKTGVNRRPLLVTRPIDTSNMLFEGRRFTTFTCFGKPRKRHKPPVLPESLKLNATFYAGMFKEDTGESVLLKILVSGQWKWVKVHYQSAPFPDGWQKASPSLVLKSNGKVFLNWTIERYLPATGGIKVLMQDGNRVCAVDTDLDGELMKAVVLDVDADGVVSELARMTVSGHTRHVKRRKSRLGKIAVKMGKTGIVSRGFASSQWDKIQRSEKDAANQLSAQIVDFAHRWGCAVIVFEALKNLKPQRGKYSHRSNQKRAYWLKSKVIKEVARIARQNHNILTAHVSPKDTSRLCVYDGSELWRGSLYKPTLVQMISLHDSSNLCYYTVTGLSGNAGYNAARNIGLKFSRRFYESPELVRVGFDGIASKVRG